MFLHATTTEEGLNRSRGRRKCASLRALVLSSNGASGAAGSELMEKVSANGSLTPRRGHLGPKHGEIDRNGNLNSTQVCHPNAAFAS